MEIISNAIQRIEATTQQVLVYEDAKRNVPTINIGDKQYRIKTKQDGVPYLSAYTDQKANAQAIAVMMKQFGNYFNIDNQALQVYVVTLEDSDITTNQLLDSLKHIYATWDNSKFGKPRVADILNFDKVSKHKAFYSLQEIIKMTHNYVIATNGEYNIDTYNQLLHQFFTVARDNDKHEIVNKSTGDKFFVLTAVGEQNKDKLLYCLEHSEDEMKNVYALKHVKNEKIG